MEICWVIKKENYVGYVLVHYSQIVVIMKDNKVDVEEVHSNKMINFKKGKED